MADASDLLRRAGDLLDGAYPVPPARAPRAAALLARQALEEAIRDVCAARVGVTLGRASTRSQLLCLRILAGPDIADPAEMAWMGLSRACHQHSYELTPTVAEVRRLINLVAKVSGAQTQGL